MPASSHFVGHDPRRPRPKDGESKLLARCTLPLTGTGCIRRVITDLGLFDIEAGALMAPEDVPEMAL